MGVFCQSDCTTRGVAGVLVIDSHSSPSSSRGCLSSVMLLGPLMPARREPPGRRAIAIHSVRSSVQPDRYRSTTQHEQVRRPPSRSSDCPPAILLDGLDDFSSTQVVQEGPASTSFSHMRRSLTESSKLASTSLALIHAAWRGAPLSAGSAASDNWRRCSHRSSCQSLLTKRLSGYAGRRHGRAID